MPRKRTKTALREEEKLHIAMILAKFIGWVVTICFIFLLGFLTGWLLF